jgi:hypothetical protein
VEKPHWREQIKATSTAGKTLLGQYSRPSGPKACPRHGQRESNGQMIHSPASTDLPVSAWSALSHVAEPSKLVRSDNTPPTSLLIEGWRGLNHSYGLVNQYQILELLKIDGLRLFHHDLPFFNESGAACATTPASHQTRSGRSTPCRRPRMRTSTVFIESPPPSQPVPTTTSAERSPS